MGPREFHIWDFPEEKVRVLFRNHEEFLDNARRLFFSQKAFANFLGVKSYSVYQWRAKHLFIPLNAAKKIVDKAKLDWLDVERDILSYKGVSTGTPIFNPKLPIKESPEVFSIITHIICDGSVNKNGIPIYTNKNKILIDELDSKLKNTFGNFKPNIYFGSGTNRDCYQYRFPKVFIELIEHFYNINFYNKKEIPGRIFDLPSEFSSAVVRAFADDEGSVDLNRRISFAQKDKELLINLQKLLKSKLKFNQLTEIKEKDKDYYFFCINSLEIEKYLKEIGFSHPEKDMRLRKIISNKLNGFKPGQHSPHGEIREKLLKLLKDRILSTYDIMRELKVNKSNINKRIKKLINEGLIIQHHKTGQTVFWKTTEKN
jgi:hypothetical protein